METPTQYYCPVCATAISYLQVWQQPGSDRIRIFCYDCARGPEYRDFSKQDRIILSYDGFSRFAASRLLAHVLKKEREKQKAAGAG
jgi:hypothetical protein